MTLMNEFGLAVPFSLIDEIGTLPVAPSNFDTYSNPLDKIRCQCEIDQYIHHLGLNPFIVHLINICIRAHNTSRRNLTLKLRHGVYGITGIDTLAQELDLVVTKVQ